MNKKCVKVIFDRTGKAKKTGRGKVEIRVYLATNVRKYIVLGETTKASWKTYQNSKELAIQVERYEEIVRAMKLLGEDMTIENFNAHIDTEKNKSKKSTVDTDNTITPRKNESAKIGLISISSLMKRQGGSSKTYITDDTFTVELIFPAKPTPSL